ncbi:uncharacterized protein [Spinacia oleracea]|uniref:Reverse transcriptase domain-containing protein n=1 Tax=Spinacia oleracea TaxID=3562 RepID=A0ABM3RQ89_SPIOL|nr:uncharacterized protein LOC130471595 [Spinacia oleracea]
MGKAVQWPPKSSKPDSKKDPSKWCDFHADIGHTTNECVALRREVAYLLKNGYLKDVMSDKARGVINKDNSNSPSRPPPPPPHTKTVNFIARGSDVCGLTYSAAKSSTNVMMLDDLKEMGLNPDTDVVKKSTVLIGFSGEAKTTFGEVTLPVYAQGVNQQSSPDPTGYKEPKSEQLDEVILDPTKPEQVVFIGCDVPDITRSELITFLKANADGFAWSHEDIPGISPDVITHKLSVDPHHKPVKQKRRKFAPERNQIINDEVQQLLDTGKIREVKYPDWLANVVVVRKKNGKWRVCIAFTYINKACLKDSFPLPHINAMVDATAGHEMLTFMDAFTGYNQILMHPDDQEKTVFITERETYCYKVMPFGLRNAGATYQRLVNKMFRK